MNVQITLKADVFDVESKLVEVQSIRDWIDELVEWDISLYEIRYHMSGKKMIVWFEHDEHALLFKLRYGE